MTPLPLVAVVGNPNAGKSALFNALTGARQKVGNYPGVTVERKSGRLTLADGRPVELIDLPGTYSLDPTSPDEAVTRDVVLGTAEGRAAPDALVIVRRCVESRQSPALRAGADRAWPADGRRAQHGRSRRARRAGARSRKRLEAELGVPVIATVAVRRRGMSDLQAALDDMISAPRCGGHEHAPSGSHSRCSAAPAPSRSRRRCRETPGPPLDPPARRSRAPSDRRAGDPVRAAVRHVPGGVRLGERPISLDRGAE